MNKSHLDLVNELLPDNFILNALREDIGAKPGNRTKELELAMKIKQWDKLTVSVESDDNFEEYSKPIRDLVDELNRLHDEEENNSTES
jgi:hypothetical protein